MQRHKKLIYSAFLCLKNDALTSINIFHSWEKQNLLFLCCWDGCANLFKCVALINRKLNRVRRLCKEFAPRYVVYPQRETSKKFIRPQHLLKHAHRTVCFERTFLISTLGNDRMRSSDGAYFIVCRSLYLQLPIFAIPKSVVS